MFWLRLLELCNKNGTSPTAVVKLLNIGAGSVTKWKNGTTPRGTTLLKLCDYFGVSVDYLLGKEDEKKPTDDGELGEDVIIYHRDGKTKKKRLTKAQMDMLSAMIEALPDDSEGL